MAEGQELSLWMMIRSIFDRKGTDEGEQGIKGVGRASKEAGVEVEGLGESFRTLKSQLAELFTIVEIIHQVKEALTELGTVEQSMNQLELAAKRNGHDFGELKERVEEASLAFQKNAGINDAETVPALVKMYDATGDVEKSIGLVELATNVSIGTGKNFAEAMHIVSQAAQGNTRGLKELNISIDQSASKTDQASNALDKIEKKYGGATEAAKGQNIELARLRESWEDLRNKAIEPVSHALVYVGKVITTTITGVGTIFSLIFEQARNAAVQVGHLGGMLKNLLTLNLEGAKEELEAGKRDQELSIETSKELMKGWLADTAKLWYEHEEHKTIATKKGADLRLPIETAAIHNEQKILQAQIETIKARIAAEDSYAVKAMLRMKLIQLEREKDLAVDEKGTKKTAAEKDAIERTYVAKVLALRKSLEAELTKEREQFLAEEQKRADRLTKIRQAETDVHKKLLDQQEKLEKDIDKRALISKQKLHDEKLAMIRDLAQKEALTAQTLFEINEQFAEKEIELDREVAKTKLEVGIGAARGVISAAQGAFGDSKELSIASAIIDTYEAATVALTAGPILGPILAAITVALGLANVAKIASTEPTTTTTSGKGFDISAYDNMAYAGGERWARDMVRKYNSGADATLKGYSAGMLSAGAANSKTGGTIDQRRTINVTLVGASFLDPSNQTQVRRLKAAMDIGESRIDKRLSVGAK